MGLRHRFAVVRPGCLDGRPHPRDRAPAARPARRVPATPAPPNSISASAPPSTIWATALVILGHFYQRDEVDPVRRLRRRLLPARQCRHARGRHAEAIVFCGVHFMAETADMLSRPDQAVILPNLAAGCSMADMADIDSVTECWEQLEELYGTAPDTRMAVRRSSPSPT